MFRGMRSLYVDRKENMVMHGPGRDPHLGQTIDNADLSGRYITDLYDLYDLAHAAG